MQKIEALFREYNDVVKHSYLDYYMEVERKPLSVYDKSESEFEKKLEKDIRKWEYKPSSSVGGCSPSEYFDSVEGLDMLMDAFSIGARLCDRNLPHSFINKLNAYGSEAVKRLACIASDRSMLDDEDRRITALLAIRVLGKWKDTSHLDILIELLKEYSGKIDIVAEEIKDALIAAGTGCNETLIEEINSSQKISEAHEYIIVALAETAREKKTEDAFFCLKSAFNRMERKAIGAICLGNYGDRRAVTVLRSYVESNLDSIDSMTFYEIKTQVEKLGGNMDDLFVKY